MMAYEFEYLLIRIHRKTIKNWIINRTVHDFENGNLIFIRWIDSIKNCVKPTTSPYRQSLTLWTTIKIVKEWKKQKQKNKGVSDGKSNDISKNQIIELHFCTPEVLSFLFFRCTHWQRQTCIVYCMCVVVVHRNSHLFSISLFLTFFLPPRYVR